MTATKDELRDEYGSRICACQRPVSQHDSDWEWLRYLKRLNEETGDLQVYGLYMKRPRDAGLALIFAFIRGEIDAVDLVRKTKEQTSDDYVGILQAAGLIDRPPQPAYRELVDEVDLELLKAYTPLRGMDPESESTCEAVALAASTIWFRYVSQLHALVGLPSVGEVGSVVTLLSPIERTVLAGNDFVAYAMESEAERAKYQAVLKGKT